MKPHRCLRPDTPDALMEDAVALSGVVPILVDRFSSGKHDETAKLVREAANELVSRSRHPRHYGPKIVSLANSELLRTPLSEVSEEEQPHGG